MLAECFIFGYAASVKMVTSNVADTLFFIQQHEERGYDTIL